MNVSVRMSAAHHGPRREQTVETIFLTADHKDLIAGCKRGSRNTKNLVKLGPVARFALALCLVCSPALGAPALAGIFSGGDLGLLDFSTADGKVVAKFKKGGACGFRPDMQVMSGVFEGNVFVGSVLVCQQGPSCDPEHSYPFLGVWHESTLSGEVKLDSSCRSPGLNDKRLNIAIATAEEKLLLRPETNSAALIAATKPLTKREQQEQIEKALIFAQKKMKEGDYRVAQQSFEKAINYQEENWAAHAGLGVAELALKNTDKAIANLQRALQLTKGSRISEADLGDIHYNLACALSRGGQKREALASLAKAVKALPAGSMVDQLDADHDLDSLRAEQDFKKMLGDARIARERANRKRTP